MSTVEAALGYIYNIVLSPLALRAARPEARAQRAGLRPMAIVVLNGLVWD